MQIAVLADIHGNLPALRAVLAEIDRDPVDSIVIAGDIVGGPMVVEVLELISARAEPLHWVSGNTEREAVAAYDGKPMADDPPGRPLRGARRHSVAGGATSSPRGRSL